MKKVIITTIIVICVVIGFSTIPWFVGYIMFGFGCYFADLFAGTLMTIVMIVMYIALRSMWIDIYRNIK